MKRTFDNFVENYNITFQLRMRFICHRRPLNVNRKRTWCTG